MKKPTPMKRALPTNINTVQHWNKVFSTPGEYTHADIDTLKVADTTNHIEDGKRVVDLGCGNGHFLKAIKDKRPNCECVGVDFSGYSIGQLQKERPDITWIKEDVTKTSLKSESFDYVLSFEVLEHLDEPHKLVAELARLCKPGGKALLTTPYQDHVPSKEHVWLYDYQDLEELFKPHFSQVWVSPWASGLMVLSPTQEVIYPLGNWDTVFVKAIK